MSHSECEAVLVALDDVLVVLVVVFGRLGRLTEG